MKKILSFTAALFMSISLFAQAPQGINYQGVARDNSGNALASQNIGIKLSVLDGSPTGTAVYSETFALTTDANGLFALVIGTGTPTVGIFTGIDWSTGGGKWLEVSMDAAGGTSYQLVGTSQLMSVPYALYAGSVAKSGGKQTLVLSDDVTDTQADSIITADVGPNTQEIRIVGTTALTTVDLSMIHTAISVVIDNNDALTSVNLSGLTRCDGLIEVANCQVLNNLDLSSLIKVTTGGINISHTGITSFDMPQLLKCSGEVSLDNNPSLTTINLPGITRLPGLYINNNNGLISATLPNLTQCEQLYITGNPSLSSVNFVSVTIVSMNFTFNGNDQIAGLSMPALQTTNYLQLDHNTSMTSISFPSLTTTGATFITNCDALTSIDLSSLSSCSNNFELQQCASLTSFSLPAFSVCSGNLNINLNTTLSSISLPSLTDFNNSLNVYGNALPTTAINAILAQLVAISPSITGKFIQLNGQTPAAPPSGQGITDKTTLINNGNSVQTD